MTLIKKHLKPVKQKKCKICGVSFMPQTTIASVCGFKCAVELTNKSIDARASKEQKIARKATKARLIELEPLKFWEDKAQKAFNRWIVWRDRELPCISCGTTNPNIQYCASHYRSRKAANQLRFDEDNVHKACNHYCNMQNSGNIANYRPALILKIGQDRHNALINNFFVKKWTKEECQEIERKYKKLLKNERLKLL